MAYEEITSRGWLSRIGASIKGIVVGLIILLLALGLQFWNEGRTLKREQALTEGRAQVLAVQPDTALAQNDGRLVHVVGNASAGAPLADEIFGVERQALALRRHVEMYQWREKKDTREEKQVGGGTREITRYTYEKRWDDEPIDSSNFKESGHANPDGMPYRDDSWRAADIRIGDFRLGNDAAGTIGGWDALDAADVALPENLAASFRAAGQWFVSSESPQQPQIGDLRVRFEIIPEGTLTLIARQQAGVLDTWHSSRGEELLLVERGQHSAKALFDDAASSNSKTGWAFRIGGFVLAWLSFMLLLKPLAVLADVIPLLGRLVGTGLAIVSGVLAVVTSVLAISSGWLWYRPWLLGVIVLVIGALVVWLFKRRGRAPVTGAVPQAPVFTASPPPPPPASGTPPQG